MVFLVRMMHSVGSSQETLFLAMFACAFCCREFNGQGLASPGSLHKSNTYLHDTLGLLQVRVLFRHMKPTLGHCLCYAAAGTPLASAARGPVNTPSLLQICLVRKSTSLMCIEGTCKQTTARSVYITDTAQ